MPKGWLSRSDLGTAFPHSKSVSQEYIYNYVEQDRSLSHNPALLVFFGRSPGPSFDLTHEILFEKDKEEGKATLVQLFHGN